MFSLHSTYLQAVLVSLILLPMTGTTREVVLETESGESYLLHIGTNETFEDVFNTMSKVAAVAGQDQSSEHELKLSVSTATNPPRFRFSKAMRSQPRSYEAGISEAHASDITYILKTLANSSLPKLKTAESSLKKAGQRIDDIHPLHFLGWIFTNEELKVSARVIRDRSWVWKDFVNGSIVTLTEENTKNNVMPYIPDFAARVGVDPNILIPIAQAGKWERFVTTLIEKVPRDGTSGRYDH